VKLQPVIQKLTTAQETFLRAADHISASNSLERQHPECWSAGHVVAHLCLVERGVLGYADPVIRRQPKALPSYGRLHLPMALVEARLVKRKAPAIVAPQENLANKEMMIAELARCTRKDTGVPGRDT